VRAAWACLLAMLTSCGGNQLAPAVSMPTTNIAVGTAVVSIPRATRLEVPVSLDGFIGHDFKGCVVTLKLSPGLRLLSVRPGELYSVCGLDDGPIMSVSFNPDTTFTVVGVLNPYHCSSCEGGTLFNVTLARTTNSAAPQWVKLAPSPAGAVTMSPTIHDCQNYDLPVSYGNTFAFVPGSDTLRTD